MKWRLSVIFLFTAVWVALYINSFFSPEPYGGLDKLVSSIYSSEYIHDELTYFYRFYFSTAVVIAIFNVSLYILPIAIPYLAIRLYVPVYLDSRSIFSRAALVVSFLPLSLAAGEIVLDILGVYKRPFLVQ
jgi:hypothetical protein